MLLPPALAALLTQRETWPPEPNSPPACRPTQPCILQEYVKDVDLLQKPINVAFRMFDHVSCGKVGGQARTKG